MSAEHIQHHAASHDTKQLSSSERVSRALQHVPRAAFGGVRNPGDPDSKLAAIPPEPLLRIMLEALDLKGSERVLELGACSGYEAALLSQLASAVVSVVPDAASAAERGQLLRQLGCTNVELVVGRQAHGWPESAPYFAILIDAGITHVPAKLLDQIELGGRLIAPLGDASGQLIELVHCRPDGCFSETLGSCRLPMLPSASRRPSSFPWRQESS